MREFDLVVIGAGPGGYPAAILGAKKGLRVAIIDRRAWLGGVCLNVGCIPSKILLDVARKVREARELMADGVLPAREMPLDFGRIMNNMRGRITKMRGGVEQLLRGNGVTLIDGHATFEDSHTLQVTNGVEEERLRGEHIIIATGASPTSPPGIVPDGRRILTYREIFSLDNREAPPSLVIIGGGVVGLELACFFQTIGTRVTVIEFQPRILPMVDAEAVAVLERKLRKDGMEFFTNTAVARIEVEVLKSETMPSSQELVTLFFNNGDRIETDYVLVATGLKPNTAGLGLEKIGVQCDQRGFIIIGGDDYKTTIPNIFALGDVITLPHLTSPHPGLAHVATAEARVAVAHIVDQEETVDLDYGLVPMCIYTDPEIASFGPQTEDEARALSREWGWDTEVRMVKFPYSHLGRAIALDRTEGFVKLVLARDPRDGTHQILGATLIGEGAAENIHVLLVATDSDTAAEVCSEIVFAHPNWVEAIHEALDEVKGGAIHAPPKKRS